MTMIEVTVSALLVALIVVGTLGGFDTAGRATTDERAHNQATLLAGQDEERMRGMSATELGRFGTSTQTVNENGTAFTITSSAQYVTASKEKYTCETNEGANYIQTTSKVSWGALGSREKVTQSSIVDVPSSLSLLVKVWNQNHEALAGATVTVTSTGGTTLAEQTTPTSGCVVFGGLEKEVRVYASVPNYVNEAEEVQSTAEPKEAKLSSSSLTTLEFVMAPSGSASVKFESNGSTAGVTGDTFFMSHTGVTKALVGGKAGTYSSSVTLSKLFPFQTVGSPPTANPYTIYAGDCAENEPAKVTENVVKNRTVQIEPNGVTEATVEVPAFNLTVYKGTTTTEGVLGTATSAKIINTKCSKTGHAVTISSSGLLEQKYQPYAKELEVCVVGLVEGSYYKSTQGGFKNTSKTGSSYSFFLKKSFEKSGSPLTC